MIEYYVIGILCIVCAILFFALRKKVISTHVVTINDSENGVRLYINGTNPIENDGVINTDTSATFWVVSKGDKKTVELNNPWIKYE